MTVLSLEFLDHATPEQLKMLAVDDLMGLIAAFEKYSSLFKRRKESLEEGLKCRYLEAAQSALKETHRDTGRTSITDGIYIIRVEIPKRVSWDQKELLRLRTILSPEQWNSYVKATYVIEESLYKALPEGFKTLFASARLLKGGKPTFNVKGINA